MSEFPRNRLPSRAEKYGYSIGVGMTISGFVLRDVMRGVTEFPGVGC
jgi:hypothetical protein